nr:MAG: hypothetical protein [Bacteriophage sp.]
MRPGFNLVAPGNLRYLLRGYYQAISYNAIVQKVFDSCQRGNSFPHAHLEEQRAAFIIHDMRYCSILVIM